MNWQWFLFGVVVGFSLSVDAVAILVLAKNYKPKKERQGEQYGNSAWHS